jgi:uncharacterized protein (TIGR00255 family)
MKSMTGYAVGESENNVFSASLEIKGYNSRFLDIAVYMPAQYSCIENNIRKAVLQFCLRGKVDITIRIKEKQNNMPVCISEAAAGAYLKAAETLRRQMQSAYEAGETMLQPENKLPIAAFLGLEGILETERPPAPSEMFQDFIMPLLLDCLKQFDAARAHEGAETAAAIAEYVLVLNTRIALIERFSDTIENTIKSNIKARFEQL